MIHTLLNDFISAFGKKTSYSQELQRETFYAAIQGDFERYIRWKFLWHIYDSKFKSDCTDYSLALESYDRNDMIFKCGDEVHFVEWKAMTLPLSNQNKTDLDKKFLDNFRQLCKSKLKLDMQTINLKANFWSAIVLVNFNKELFDWGKSPQSRFFDRHGNFQKYSNMEDEGVPTSPKMLDITTNKIQIFPKDDYIPQVNITQVKPIKGEIEMYFLLYNFTTYLSTNTKKFNKLKLDGKPNKLKVKKGKKLVSWDHRVKKVPKKGGKGKTTAKNNSTALEVLFKDLFLDSEKEIVKEEMEIIKPSSTSL